MTQSSLTTKLIQSFGILLGMGLSLYILRGFGIITFVPGGLIILLFVGAIAMLIFSYCSKDGGVFKLIKIPCMQKYHKSSGTIRKVTKVYT